MTIIGIGTDIVQMDRIAKIFTKYGQKFIEKNFHALELEKFSALKRIDHLSYLSKRFAAKEAISKAFGTGVAEGLSFKEIAIINNEKGAPIVIIDPIKFPNYANYKINISISDDPPIAVAFAVISL
jgi:holo-[acyl-carrier protein] synthase